MSGLIGFAIVIGIIAGIGKGIKILVSDSKRSRPRLELLRREVEPAANSKD